MSSNASDESCFFVYLSVMICSVVSVLDGSACVCRSVTVQSQSVVTLGCHFTMINNLYEKNINMFTHGLRVKSQKHSV